MICLHTGVVLITTRPGLQKSSGLLGKMREKMACSYVRAMVLRRVIAHRFVLRAGVQGQAQPNPPVQTFLHRSESQLNRKFNAAAVFFCKAPSTQCGEWPQQREEQTDQEGDRCIIGVCSRQPLNVDIQHDQSHFVLHSSSINSTIDSSAASILSCQCESSQHMHE